MRQSFIKSLTECSDKDTRIYLLVADIGYGLIDEFAGKYPTRFINVGVAEQNMISIATGLALSGKIVFCYSIANFPTFRCLEQIRNDVCYHNANVIIVAGGCGLGYGALGMTHHATEDLAIMRALPNMTVIAPGDPTETALAIKEMAQGIGACYLRLGRNEPVIHEPTLEFKIGKAITLLDGRVDATLISTGNMLNTAIQVADKLDRQGIKLGVISMHTLKPLDVDAIKTALKVSPVIITLEEHSIIGGLGSAVAEVLSEIGDKISFRRIGIPDTFCERVGDYNDLLKYCRLTIDDIILEVERAVHKSAISNP